MSNEKIQSRPMTGEEVKVFKQAGYDPFMTDVDTEDKRAAGTKAIEMFEWIAEKIYTGVDIDKRPYPEKVELGKVTFQKTFGVAEDEVKNSQTTGPGTKKAENTVKPV